MRIISAVYVTQSNPGCISHADMKVLLHHSSTWINTMVASVQYNMPTSLLSINSSFYIHLIIVSYRIHIFYIFNTILLSLNNRQLGKANYNHSLNEEQPLLLLLLLLLLFSVFQWRKIGICTSTYYSCDI
jgi:hypothetical protein